MSVIRSFLQGFAAKIYTKFQRQNILWKHKQMLRAGQLVVGKHTYGVPEIHFYKGSEHRVTIGSYCSISTGVIMITGGIHPVDWVSTFPFRIQWKLPGAFEDGMPTSKGGIRIGSDVWIGTDAMILSGLAIGDGAVITARSVVTKDIPPYAIAAGIPAKVIKYRFPPQIVEQLLSIRWWEWDEFRIKEAVPFLNSANIQEFLSKYEPLSTSPTPSSKPPKA